MCCIRADDANDRATRDAAAVNAAYTSLQQVWKKEDERRREQRQQGRESNSSPFEVIELIWILDFVFVF